MFKRLFWIGVGVTVGALAVIKAQAYVKANTPDAARAFVFGPDQDHVVMKVREALDNGRFVIVASPIDHDQRGRLLEALRSESSDVAGSL